MSIVGQRKHGEALVTASGPDVVAVDKDKSEYHNVHVMMADKVPFSCKPGFAEGVEELSAFMKSSATLAQRRETRIALFDTPYAWPLRKARKVFPNLECVGGDPMHACIDMEKYIAQGHKLAKDFRIVIVKFNSEASARFRSCAYFDIGGAPADDADRQERALSVHRLCELHERLHDKTYRFKPYVSHKQYCDDIRAIKHHHAVTCAKLLPRAKGKKTVGDLMDKYMDSTRFHYYQNIIIYRAKSGERCQFGTTPNEAVMNQLKTYNANVFTSTRARCALTLDLFSFGKVLSLHLKKLAPPGMDYASPGSCHSHAMSLLRKGLANGALDIPSATLAQPWAKKRAKKRAGGAVKQYKRPAGAMKRFAQTTDDFKPRKSARR